MVSKLNNTKDGFSNWTVDMKIDWQKKTKPSIFDNPKWVTAVSTDLEIGLVEGKDYKVYSEKELYEVVNDFGHTSAYPKDRFYKVTYEDVLPEKVATEDKERIF